MSRLSLVAASGGYSLCSTLASLVVERRVSGVRVSVAVAHVLVNCGAQP